MMNGNNSQTKSQISKINFILESPGLLLKKNKTQSYRNKCYNNKTPVF